MINAASFLNELKKRSIDFFTGVPDSLLKDFCAYLQDTVPAEKNIIAANEGGAVALGAGHYLATGNPSLIYMQNSGQGNAVNPLLSLNDPLVYGIPALLVIGWRGEPGIKDEPQHAKQGLVTRELLDVMGIEYSILSMDTSQQELQQILDTAATHLAAGSVFALLVKKGSFESYSLMNKNSDLSSLSREDAINTVLEGMDNSACIVSTTGMISRELFECREARGETHSTDFLTVGSMGHSSQIAAGIAVSRPDQKVFCFDGDGAFLMHMGGVPLTASLNLSNYTHIVFNNGAHDSVGGQPTIADQLSLTSIAEIAGFTNTYMVDDLPSLEAALKEMRESQGPVFLEVKVRKGARKDLGRPTLTPKEQMANFMNFLRNKTC